ncbi:hypothetical protein MKW94_024217 [Papaver nudicaule]|uniref:Uncharacterized protein n=1 Tax=Papaver nudicaule TaxID=74823 RepID=A0AA42B3Z6_PAPNU|nr:hypothetical protein [Papaver nudicaule]
MADCWEKLKYPIRRVWIKLTIQLGLRDSGLKKLQYEVNSCEYEDIHVMWEMLRRTESDLTPIKPSELNRIDKPENKRPLNKMIMLAKRAPFLCRSF